MPVRTTPKQEGCAEKERLLGGANGASKKAPAGRRSTETKSITE
jgi:hypothetical protein